MTTQILNHREADGKCELCGMKDELRPYGPNGEWICFDCGMKDEAITAAQFAKVLGRADVTVIDTNPAE
jgi:ribosomal protein L37AE/L43A